MLRQLRTSPLFGKVSPDFEIRITDPTTGEPARGVQEGTPDVRAEPGRVLHAAEHVCDPLSSEHAQLDGEVGKCGGSEVSRYICVLRGMVCIYGRFPV
jgi:hypothetical protein